MGFTMNVTQTAGRIQRLAERSWGLYRLRHERSPLISCITQSVRDARANKVTLEEKEWIGRIESLRAELNASSRPITRTDFGAGNPDSTRTQEEMRRGVEVSETLRHLSQGASNPPFWCLLLFKLIRAMRPSSCVEMGTAVGISGAYQAAALKLNGRGTLVTLEGAGSLADVANNTFQRLGLQTVEIVVGRFDDTLSTVLKRRQPVDYVFIDGHHDEQATLSYFEQIYPFLAEKALVVFDDIAWSDGMRKAWKAIAQDTRVGGAVDMGLVGVCAIDRTIAGGRYFRVPMR
jgi:predicted O-methyltransferase YrrM